MSLLALSMDIFLAVLLIAALVMGVRLNARLKALRQSHEGFARAIVDLNDAAVRAERGLAGLREAATETHDSLLARIDTARSLAAKLDGQIQTARGLIESQALTRVQTPPPAAPPPPPARFEAASSESAAHDSLRRLALRFGLSRGDESVQSSPQREAEPRPARQARPTRQRLPEEDDLFEPTEIRPAARSTPAFRRRADQDGETPRQPSTPSNRLTADDFAAQIRARRSPGGTAR
jgi:hypothetical protein